MRLAFIISGKGSFPNFLNNNIKYLKNCQISMVIADRLCSGYDYFKNKTNIPTYLLEYHRYKGCEFENTIIKLLSKEKIDYIYLFFNRIIKEPLLSSYENRIFNSHPSLLPKYKGFNAIEKSYADRVPFYGASIHLTNEVPDSGPLISQCVIPREVDDSLKLYRHKLFLMQAVLLLDLTQKLKNKNWDYINLQGSLNMQEKPPSFYPPLSLEVDKIIFKSKNDKKLFKCLLNGIKNGKF